MRLDAKVNKPLGVSNNRLSIVLSKELRALWGTSFPVVFFLTSLAAWPDGKNIHEVADQPIRCLSSLFSSAFSFSIRENWADCSLGLCQFPSWLLAYPDFFSLFVNQPESMNLAENLIVYFFCVVISDWVLFPQKKAPFLTWYRPPVITCDGVHLLVFLCTCKKMSNIVWFRVRIYRKSNVEVGCVGRMSCMLVTGLHYLGIFWVHHSGDMAGEISLYYVCNIRAHDLFFFRQQHSSFWHNVVWGVHVLILDVVSYFAWALLPNRGNFLLYTHHKLSASISHSHPKFSNWEFVHSSLETCSLKSIITLMTTMPIIDTKENL